jgi:hypothetical protein
MTFSLTGDYITMMPTVWEKASFAVERTTPTPMERPTPDLKKI